MPRGRRRWSGAVERPRRHAHRRDIVVDALFGAGLDRDVEGLPRAMIEAMKRAERAGDRGRSAERHQWHHRCRDGHGGQCRRTVTFFRRKPGHLLLPGRLHCGAIEVADIGIPDSVLAAIKPDAFANDPALWGGAVSGPELEGHKYGRGHAVMVPAD